MSRRRKLSTGVFVLLCLAGAAVGTGWYFGLLFNEPTVRDAPALPVPSTSVRVLASGLTTPWGIDFLPDGTALVTERDTGRILAVRAGGSGNAGTVTEIGRVAESRPGGEGGLLGIAVSPRFGVDRSVYVYYSTDEDNRIGRLTLDASGRISGAPTPIFTDIPRANTHDGGRIAFGPDGLLYVGTGDAGDRVRAQNEDRLNGKILRITTEGKPATGNPFGDSPVYSYGHRNVQGLAWDSSGQLFATEFGQNRYDELNLIEPGNNYGWPLTEGFGDDPKMTNPVATWATSDASPSGLAIVGGDAYLACLRGEKLYRVGLDGHDPQTLLAGEYGRLRAVAAAPDGALWVLTSNRDGRGSPTDTDDRILRLALP